MLVLTKWPLAASGACIWCHLGTISRSDGCGRGAGAGAEHVLSSLAQQNSAIRAGATQRISAIAPFQPNSWRATVLPAPCLLNLQLNQL